MPGKCRVFELTLDEIALFGRWWHAVRKTPHFTQIVSKDQRLEAELGAVFERLYSLKLHLDDEGNPSPIDLPLTSTGKRAWIQFYNEHAAEQADLSGDLAAAEGVHTWRFQ